MKLSLKYKYKKQYEISILTLFAQKSPHALQSDLGPDGPRRIIGVDIELMPQFVHLKKAQNSMGINKDVNVRSNIKQRVQILIRK